MSMSKVEVPVTEYATFKGVSRQRVVKLLQEGRIEGRLRGNRWSVLVDEYAYRPVDLGGCRILTLFCHAGGVGKTTLVRDVGYQLSSIGYRVLLIDMDPQCNLTEWLLGSAHTIRVEQTIRALTTGAGESMPVPISGLFGKSLDLIPANLDLALLDLEVAQIPNGDMLLRQALEDISNDYDIVLIDSPPSLSKTTTMTGLAGEGFVVPVETSTKGLVSLRVVTRLAKTYARATGRKTREWIRLLVPTKYDPRTRVDVEVMDELRKLQQERGITVSAPMHARPGIYKKACLEGKPIGLLFPMMDAAQEVESISTKLIEVLVNSRDDI